MYRSQVQRRSRDRYMLDTSGQPAALLATSRSRRLSPRNTEVVDLSSTSWSRAK